MINSFYDYMMDRVAGAGCGIYGGASPQIDEEENRSLLWAAYLDWLESVQFDIGPVLKITKYFNQFIDDCIGSLQTKKPTIAAALRYWNGLNIRQLELLQDNDEETFEELYGLSQGVFYRYKLMRQALLEAGEDVDEFDYALGSIHQEISLLADELERITLRNFYSAFKKKQYIQLSVLCEGSEFMRSAASSLLNADAPSEREYDVNRLILLNSDLNLYLFDDDENVLLPEVVDMLYSDQ
ncbi:hypothetical protein [Paenibacillus sp. GXUN7292]|uniref:hypothetical protein n=1 Tax=Paenibacillus sp. GXUN7292 TaxID=3422499 RepID=UPI003D7E3486